MWWDVRIVAVIPVVLAVEGWWCWWWQRRRRWRRRLCSVEGRNERGHDGVGDGDYDCGVSDAGDAGDAVDVGGDDNGGEAVGGGGDAGGGIGRSIAVCSIMIVLMVVVVVDRVAEVVMMAMEVYVKMEAKYKVGLWWVGMVVAVVVIPFS